MTLIAAVVIGQNMTKPMLHKLYAQSAKHWMASESEAFVKIVMRESSGNPHETTSRSSSAGLFGFLSGTMRKYGVSIHSPLKTQAQAFISYCDHRYGSIAGAWKHHLKYHWY